MSDKPIRVGIGILLERLAIVEKEAEDIRADLEKLGWKPPARNSHTKEEYPPPRKGQYLGMTPRDALISYLSERGGKSPIIRAQVDLEEAGVKFGNTPRRYLAVCRTTINQNTWPRGTHPIFHKEKYDEFRLLTEEERAEFELKRPELLAQRKKEKAAQKRKESKG